jgi:hypothetical protein
MKLKYLFQCLFVLMLLLSEASVFIPQKVEAAAPVVQDNKVFISLPDAYIEASPATLSASGWVDVVFWTRNYDGAVDVVYGFNGLDNVKAINPESWETYEATKTRQVDAILTAEFKPEKVISTNTLAKVPLVADTDLSLNAKYAEIVYEEADPMTSKTTQQTKKLAYDTYDDRTGAYLYKYNGTQSQEYKEVVTDWNKKAQPSVVQLDYAEAKKWDVAQHKSVKRNEPQMTRVWIDIPFMGKDAVTGKYNIGIKPSSLTLQQAKDQGKLWLLDPWYSSSWLYRKELTVYGSSAGVQTNYQKLIRVYKADAGANMPENLAQYTTGQDDRESAFGTVWRSQVFTAEATATAKKVWLYLSRQGAGTGASWVVALKAVDGAFKPTGANLCSGTINLDYVGTGFDWYEFDMGAGTALTLGTKYAIVLYSAGGDGTHYANVGCDTTLAYGGGKFWYSVDSGSTWTDGARETWGMVFQVVTTTTGTIPLRVDCEGHSTAWPNDIRFTKADGTTLLDYWIEYSDANYADCWVELDTIAQMTALTEHTHYYLYYGNAGASAVSSGSSTMVQFDNFDSYVAGSNLNGQGSWTATAAGVVISTDHATSGANSAKIIGSAGSNTMYKTLTATSQAYWVGQWNWKEDAAGVYVGSHGNGTNVATPYINNTEDIYFTATAGGATDTGLNAVADAWNKIDRYSEIFTGSGSFVIRYADALSATCQMYANAGSNGVITLTDITSGVGNDTYIDDWFVAKFAVSQPLWGTSGAEVSLSAPTVVTGLCTGTGGNWAIVNGSVTVLANQDGTSFNSTSRGFNYGLTNAYGTTSSTAGDYGISSFSALLTGLAPSTTYHYRAFATATSVTGVGLDATFTTSGAVTCHTVFETAATGSTNVYGVNWAAQTFTTPAGMPYTVKSVSVEASIVGTPGTVTLGIYRSTGGVPVGSVLTSGTFSGSLLSIVPSWYSVDVTEYALEPSTVYALVCSLPAGTSSNYIKWSNVNVGGYAGGASSVSTNSGNSWSATFTTDMKYTGLGETVTEAPSYDDDTWVTPQKVDADDGVYANITAVTFDNLDYSYVLKATQFGFAVPSTATISGIQIDVDRFSNVGSAKDIVIQLTKDGTARVGTNMAVAGNWPAVSTMATYGGSASLCGTTWTPAEINAATFGVHLVTQATADNSQVFVDYIRVTVYYTYAAIPDQLFRICGNPVLQIQDVKVFQTYRQTSDWLVAVRYVNLYPPYYDTYDVKKYFTLQLVDSTATVKASSPIPAWGNRVGNVYLSAATTTPLTYGGDYRVRIYGTFTGNPYVEYAIQATDWMGDDLVNLDSWVITSSTVIGTYYSTTMTTYIAERGEVLNSTGGGIFNNGISGLAQVRPAIFQTYTVPSTYTPGTITQAGRLAIPSWQTNVGPDATIMLTRLGNIVGIGGDIIAVIAFLIMMFVLMALAFPAGNTTAAMVLSLPMLAGAIWFGMDLLYIGMLALVAAFLFIKNFWLDKGN